METVGHLLQCSPDQPGSFDIFNSQEVQRTGTGTMQINNNVTLTGSNYLIVRPGIYHSFDVFNVKSNILILTDDYHFEIGLKGSQLRWSQNTYFSIRREGEETVISLHDAVNSIVRFTQNIPVIFSGKLQVRVVYADLCWKMLLIHNDSYYTFTHKYNRETINGHVTSRFGLNNITGTVVVESIAIEVPVIKDCSLFVGDSITWGSTRPFGAITFPERYAIEYGDKNVSVFASGSASSIDVVNAIDAIKLIRPTELFLLIGDNDDYYNPAQFATNITTILTQLAPVIDQIYLCNLTPEIADTGYAVLRDIIWSIEAPANVTKLDSWAAMARGDNPDLVRPELVTDGVHLSASGHNQHFQTIKNLFELPQ